MRFIRTRTESLNVSEINRIAYLSPTERRRLSDKLRRPDWHRPDDGEVVADMGRVEPVILGYVDDKDVGSHIVAMLTDFAIGVGPAVIDYDYVAERAAVEVKVIRYQAEMAKESAENDDDVNGVAPPER